MIVNIKYITCLYKYNHGKLLYLLLQNLYIDEYGRYICTWIKYINGITQGAFLLAFAAKPSGSSSRNCSNIMSALPFAKLSSYYE